MESLSSIIVNALKSKGLTVEKLSVVSGVSERFITLLIEEDFKKLPALPYSHGYIVKISEVLGLDGQELWNRFFKDNEMLKKSGGEDRLPHNRFAVSKINKKLIVAAIVALIIAIYFLFRILISFDVSRELTLIGMEGETILAHEPRFEVRGRVSPDYQLTLNGDQVYPDVNGNFEEVLNLDPGFNTVIFNVKGMLGREGRVVKQIFYEPAGDETETATSTESNQKP